LIALPVAAVAIVLFALTAGAAAPRSTSWTGVVVAKDSARKAIVTASAQGTVRTLRVTRFAGFSVGQRLSVRAGKLRDGTFRSHVAKVSGRAVRTKLRGTIVRHQPALRRYLVSAGGSVLAVRSAAARRTASVSARGPRAGDRVLMSLTLTGGTPTATSVQTLGHDATFELEGIFLGLTPDGSIRLAVAERGEVIVAVPAGTTPPAAQPGDELEIDVTVDAAGGFTLAPDTGPVDDDDSSSDDDSDDVTTTTPTTTTPVDDDSDDDSSDDVTTTTPTTTTPVDDDSSDDDSSDDTTTTPTTTEDDDSSDDTTTTGGDDDGSDD
jgi:hypothetical protein